MNDDRENSLDKKHPERPDWRRKLGFALWGIRWLDFPFFTAFPTMGALLAINQWNTAVMLRLLFFIACNLVFAAHVYIFNDWSDGTLNPQEPLRRPRHALKHPVLSTTEILSISFILCAAALMGYALISPVLAAVMIFIEIITAAYSHPRINLKGKPVISTTIHFAGAFSYFIVGWIAFAPLSREALALALFFGLVLSAGHFSNEIEDFENDMAAGIRTNAIAFGQRAVFRAGLLLFLLSSIFFLIISLKPGPAGSPASTCHVPLALIIAWIVQAIRCRNWKGGDPIRGFRNFYRLTYALLCAALLFIKLMQSGPAR